MNLLNLGYYGISRSQEGHHLVSGLRVSVFDEIKSIKLILLPNSGIFGSGQDGEFIFSIFRRFCFMFLFDMIVRASGSSAAHRVEMCYAVYV